MALTKLYSMQFYSIIAITFTVIAYLNVVTANRNREDNFMRNDFYNDQGDDRHTNILSRKRRYLTFPQGSSFQLVYDLIVGVVDFTNYLILGVTSALAWQLPSEPPSEIIENLREKLNDGTLGISRNDTIENIQYIDTNKKQEYHNKPTYSYITSSSNPSYVSPQSSHYYSSDQFHPPLSTKYYSSRPNYYSSPSRKQDTQYYSTRGNPLMEWKQSQNVSPAAESQYAAVASRLSNWWNNNNRKTNKYSKKPYFQKKHRIYPVFAKRSIHNRQKRHGIPGSSLTKIDKIHLRYHRSTRHDLFPKIEKYLESHKKNGHQCVLKALCETGQKANEVEPGSFVGEIMRSIFTLPESDDPVHDYRHKIYDEAHAHQGNCTEKYPLCQESVWTADFIF